MKKTLFLFFLSLFLLSSQAFALQVKVGNFNTRTTAGAQVVPDVGCNPKAVIFYSTLASSTANATTAVYMLGVAENSSEEWAMSLENFDAQGFAVADRRFVSTACITLNENATVILEADYTTARPDGFEINVSIANATSRIIGYIAFCGPELSVDVGQFDSNATAGSQIVGGVGFEPDAILFGSTLGSTTEGNATSFLHNFGVGVSSSSRWNVMHTGSDASDPSQENRFWSTSRVVHKQGDVVTSLDIDLLSQLPDGFLLDIVTTTAAQTVGYFAMKGVQVAAGSFTQSTSTGLQQIRTVGFHPRVLMLASNRSNAASGTYEAPGSLSFGAASSPTERVAIAEACSDNVLTTECDRGTQTDAVFYSIASGTPTVLGEADFTDARPDGADITWSTSDGNARNITYFAVGNVKKGSGVIVN